jgi:hypothetical protein
MDFDAFAERMKQLGFDQVLKREWKPLTTVEEHTHPFDSSAIVVRGERRDLLGGATQRRGQLASTDVHCAAAGSAQQPNSGARGSH